LGEGVMVGWDGGRNGRGFSGSKRKSGAESSGFPYKNPGFIN